ncbi:MAG: hypothetical protein L0Y50_06505 [Beijerinckiaceae bacterium]|nr:hypothetical protein [Beijerinckiaceae bacterium]MCI0735909.1 hypothetical protein [Beijerinckiaceae bacterium]
MRSEAPNWRRGRRPSHYAAQAIGFNDRRVERAGDHVAAIRSWFAVSGPPLADVVSGRMFGSF